MTMTLREKILAHKLEREQPHDPREVILGAWVALVVTRAQKGGK